MCQYRNPLNFNPETLKAASQSLKRIDRLVASLQQRVATAQPSTPTAGSEAIVAEAAVQKGVDSEGMSAAACTGATAAEAVRAFEAAMCDDLNTPRATAALFAIVSAAEKWLKREQNPPAAAPSVHAQGDEGGGEEKQQEWVSGGDGDDEGRADVATAKSFLDAIHRMDQVFGVLYDVPTSYFKQPSTTDVVTGAATAVAGVGGVGGHGDQGAEAVPEQVLVLAAQRAELKAAKRFAEADALRSDVRALGFDIKDGKAGTYTVVRLE